jgi:putative hydrolase of HD superfamily
MSALIDTLIEIQRLKRLDRTGWTLRGLPNGTESVAAHSFGVGVSAMLIADELLARGISVNVEKILRMALLHDWAEVRIGDLPRIASQYFDPEARKEAERAAFQDIVNDGGEASRYRELFDEYEERGSLEARLVKVADVVDLLVEALALERAGARGLDEFWEVAKQPDFNFDAQVHLVIGEVFESLLRARSELG